MKASGERSFFYPPKGKKISGKNIVAGQNFGETRFVDGRCITDCVTVHIIEHRRSKAY
jgi:hypothetical protein